MHSQPTPASDRPTISGTACAWLAAAIVSATLLIVLSYLDATSLGMPRVAGSLFAAGVAVGACGFIVNVAAEKVLQRLDALESKLDEVREIAYAEGYVAATANGRHLSVVNQG